VEGLTWTEARKTCQSQSGDLISIPEFDWGILTAYILPNWSNKFNNSWHIGLQRNSLGKWTWLEDSANRPLLDPDQGWFWQPGQPYPNATFAAMANCPPYPRGSFKGVTNDTVAGFIYVRECTCYSVICSVTVKNKSYPLTS